MAPEPSLHSNVAQSLPDPAPPRAKFRLRFRKSDDLRFVSHHDLMHLFERMFRRADLRVAVTQGFHPRPKMWFPLSLALGIVGLREVLELELLQSLDADELRDRLVKQCPPGLEILGVEAIDVKKAGRVRRACYALSLASPIDDLDHRCTEFLANHDCWFQRTRPRPRRINLRPYVSELHCHADRLEMALWITPHGAARPEEIIAALGMSEWLDQGAVIERTDLEIYDELPADIEGPPEIAPATEEPDTNREPMPVASHPTSMMDNPLSFDS